MWPFKKAVINPPKPAKPDIDFCRKCGVRWGWPIPGPLKFYVRVDGGGEALRRSCIICGYFWHEPCRDEGTGDK